MPTLQLTSLPLDVVTGVDTAGDAAGLRLDPLPFDVADDGVRLGSGLRSTARFWNDYSPLNHH